MQSENTKCFSSTSNLYELKIENMTVKMQYSENNKTLDQCMLNIIKQKMKTT